MSNKNSSKSIKWDQFVVDLSLPHDVEELFESFFNSTFCKNDKYGEPLDLLLNICDTEFLRVIQIFLIKRL